MSSDGSRSSKTIVPNMSTYRQPVPTSTQDVSQPPRQPYAQRYPSSSQATGPEGTGIDHVLSQGFGRLSIATQSHNNQTTNVLLCGEPRVGKSSIVNLIARGKTIARVPSGVDGCALQSLRYDISVDGTNVSIFETVGLPAPEFGSNDYLVALEKAHELVGKLHAAGGTHLLLVCVRADRLTATTQSNYRLFSEVVFQRKVPVALVVTGLEGETDMEEWWTKNKTLIQRYGLESDRHACITTVSDYTTLQDRNYMESMKRIRELLKTCPLAMPAFLPSPREWFLHIGNGMQRFVDKYRKPTRTDIVNTLVGRLGLDSRTVQGFIDIMERGDARQNNRSGEGRPQDVPSARTAYQDPKGEMVPSSSNATQKSRDTDSGTWREEPRGSDAVGTSLDTGKRNHPIRRRTTDEVGTSQSQSQDWNIAEEDWDERNNEARRREMRFTPESRKVNSPTEAYGKSNMDMLMEDILRNFPRDLTDYVTKSDKFPFASGSSGDIYRGKFKSSRNSLVDVAIKVYKTYLQRDDALPQRVKRFQSEIAVWLKLQHPNVLPLYGTTRDPDMHPHLPAMVCPWAENGELSAYLDQRKDLPLASRLTLVNDVALGLQYLHGQRVVHGDLSGSNVLVKADGHAWIADFGLSKLLTAVGSSTAKTRPGGTVRWMDPELVDPEKCYTLPTPRSDVYSFGSIMLQILTGNIPYHHLSRDERVILAILRGTRPERPNQTAVTNGRWRFIERCWSPSEPRPSSDEIAAFTGRELFEVQTMRV